MVILVLQTELQLQQQLFQLRLVLVELNKQRYIQMVMMVQFQLFQQLHLRVVVEVVLDTQ
jgi:hypothetical protein